MQEEREGPASEVEAEPARALKPRWGLLPRPWTWRETALLALIVATLLSVAGARPLWRSLDPALANALGSRSIPRDRLQVAERSDDHSSDPRLPAKDVAQALAELEESLLAEWSRQAKELSEKRPPPPPELLAATVYSDPGLKQARLPNTNRLNAAKVLVGSLDLPDLDSWGHPTYENSYNLHVVSEVVLAAEGKSSERWHSYPKREHLFRSERCQRGARVLRRVAELGRAKGVRPKLAQELDRYAAQLDLAAANALVNAERAPVKRVLVDEAGESPYATFKDTQLRHVSTYSFGPDGLDDLGQGDDLSYGIWERESVCDEVPESLGALAVALVALLLASFRPAPATGFQGETRRSMLLAAVLSGLWVACFNSTLESLEWSLGNLFPDVHLPLGPAPQWLVHAGACGLGFFLGLLFTRLPHALTPNESEVPARAADRERDAKRWSWLSRPALVKPEESESE
ncbi:MAG: hypothetical protein JKY65_10355 [Planctomycetes bacterium]|nr:hypothetical protein [Planctomycetota bacterium]